MMSTRTREFHACPLDPLAPLDVDHPDLMHFQLDCQHGGAGVPHALFEHMFAQCIFCDLYMTSTAAKSHTCDWEV
jgi:hypothetical protein